MKWYRYVHSVLFVVSFIPLVLSLWPFWQSIMLPLIALVPFTINEIVIDRREKRTQERLPGTTWPTAGCSSREVRDGRVVRR
ncbi:hypothetical protein JOE60_003601 [Paenarthrobacter ilicis]|uniref:Uncharacterized protein n=1 Tax=Paenarthrobacter ilicis TaxID=43665 RepID=A0ABX0TP88_9MICC|nr:hypothetical protein [Paenarthrobacter ilicis]NIJ02641.1 hypothetical protein [Paenarthrobacter ilicis]